MADRNQIIEELLNQPCYIVDFLPEQVPASSKGQFFSVENYLLNEFRQYRIADKFVNIILKLMCYYKISILWDNWIEQPNPALVADIVNEIMENHSGTLNLLFPEEKALLIFEWDWIGMSIYNPNEDMQKIISALAASEGLFYRKSLQ